MTGNKVETCFSPIMYPFYENKEAVVVVVDILRATTAIGTAFMNGIKKIIPVSTLEEAKEYKDKGYLVAAERDGIVKEFADFGNSPFNFTKKKVSGKEVVYSTTNGTNTVMLAKDSYKVVIGSYLCISAIADYIKKENRNALLLCAGWKNKFNLEDSLFCGALAEKLLEDENYSTICDSTKAALDLWHMAKPNPYGYILKSAQKARLQKNGLDDVIEFCHLTDQTNIIPCLKDNHLSIL